jgi:hypothetical protein
MASVQEKKVIADVPASEAVTEMEDSSFGAADFAAGPTADSTITVYEGRQYVARLPIKVPLRVTAVDRSAAATSIDVSVTGILIETRLRLDLHEKLILTLPSPDQNQPIHLCVQVMRILEGAHNKEMPAPKSRALADIFAEVSRLTQDQTMYQYGLRIMKDDAPAWQSFVRASFLGN